jgi:tRNA(Ile)-lysidine synthase
VGIKNQQGDLVKRFTRFNKEKFLLNGNKRLLVAVSGGMDSIALCSLLLEAGVRFAIAHCNFGLRGSESNGDEDFVKAYAAAQGLELFSRRFDTSQYVEDNKVAIQEAARKLRYDWFEEIRGSHSFDYIATAHHLNDSIETVLFNLAKGTGIKGLRGIQYKNGKVVRPLLFTTREEIESYLIAREQPYREDSSNASDKYSRNFIRHHIVPLFKEINPSFEHTFASNLKTFEEVESFVDAHIKGLYKTLVFPSGSYEKISIARLKKLEEKRTVLYAILQKYGFNNAQVEDMLDGLDKGAGRQFISPTNRVIQDRQFLIVTDLAEEKSPVIFIRKEDRTVRFGDRILDLSYTAKSPGLISAQQDTALLDTAAFSYPLLLRQWKQGDYFYPLGMGMKKKKVKKFLTDIKLPLHEKEQVWVLESGQKIVWVVGYRIDERFCITPATAQSCSAMVRKA